jgi:hypothetical protein
MRKLLVLAVAGALVSAAPTTLGVAVAAAQEEESETQNRQDAAEETGASQGETEGAAEETGPPWTYQMARLGLLLLAVMGLGIWLAYYRFVVRRARVRT